VASPRTDPGSSDRVTATTREPSKSNRRTIFSANARNLAALDGRWNLSSYRPKPANTGTLHHLRLPFNPLVLHRCMFRKQFSNKRRPPTKQQVFFPPFSSGWEPLIVRAVRTEIGFLCTPENPCLTELSYFCLVGSTRFAYPSIHGMEHRHANNILITSQILPSCTASQCLHNIRIVFRATSLMD